ncbi:MAG TPA: hypothetical protein H9757_08380 [Candidatus Mediterraneibacter faecigallinarum]|uniref:Uncharacterized protein n=1 Tax=Candidatus Mediterraneibacter faecigallinarum TaxID=2838669 RepID=A0A9D2NWY6_9FIRM|nr:hypothetical protein [Candidatus Mediterraneibacter faecigallinarum]
MKIRENVKKKYLLAVFAGAVILAAGGTAAWLLWKGSSDFYLSINGSEVSQEEYLAAVDAVEYDTKMEIQEEYDTPYGEDFWEKEYPDGYGYEILAENAEGWLKYTHAVYSLAEKYGDIDDGSYEAAVKRWEADQESRAEKTAKGEVVYGLREYPLDVYISYEISMLKETYCNDYDREGMDLTEEEIQEHYESREWIFDESEENADLETARIAVERELREQKYDEIIAQKEQDSQVDGDRDAVLRFTLKNISK